MEQSALLLRLNVPDRNIGFALNEMQHADFQSLLDLMFSSMLGRIRLIKHVNSILEEAFGQR